MGSMFTSVFVSVRRSRRSAVRFSALSAVVAALALVVALLGAGPAAAHSAAVGSSPENGAQLDRSPGEVSVTFNEDLRDEYGVLKVVGPDGHFWQQGEPTVSGPVISVPVNALGPVGEYKVNFRVTSADGHPVQGQRTFTLTVAGDGEPGPLADAEELAVTGDDGGFPLWGIIVLVVVALVVVAGVIVLALRRRGA